MYLSHFGFSEQPFARVSVTNFFYDGASRGATLDALIYVLTHGEGVEGIVKVIGEEGSGKSTLCRLLMKRLPPNIQTIYFAKRDLSREELLHSLAEELKFEVASDQTSAVLVPATVCDLKNALIEKYASGGQVVLLVDEAHTLARETLEALGLLYDVESARRKLLQIVLFGQSELENTLALPSMRQFKDRVAHHFLMRPFSAQAVEDYLRFRMHAAGYRGPDIFSSQAVRLITVASGGLLQRINMLADKSLIKAFTAEMRDIDAPLVKVAMKDAGIKHRSIRRNGSNLLNRRLGGMVGILAVLALGVLGWQAQRSTKTDVLPPLASRPVEMAASAVVSAPIYPPAAMLPPSDPASVPVSGSNAPPSRTLFPSPPPQLASPSGSGTGVNVSAQENSAANTEQHGSAKLDIGGVKLASEKLLGQRVEATKRMMAKTDKNYYSIQLFVTDNIQPDRMERFLVRAQNLVDLSDLFMHSVNNEGQAYFRITYGIYPTRDEANKAMDELPQKYRTAFTPELYTLGELR